MVSDRLKIIQEEGRHLLQQTTRITYNKFSEFERTYKNNIAAIKFCREKKENIISILWRETINDGKGTLSDDYITRSKFNLNYSNSHKVFETAYSADKFEKACQFYFGSCGRTPKSVRSELGILPKVPF